MTTNIKLIIKNEKKELCNTRSTIGKSCEINDVAEWTKTIENKTISKDPADVIDDKKPFRMLKL